jgi:hypothetical protein
MLSRPRLARTAPVGDSGGRVTPVRESVVARLGGATTNNMVQQEPGQEALVVKSATSPGIAGSGAWRLATRGKLSRRFRQHPTATSLTLAPLRPVGGLDIFVLLGHSDALESQAYAYRSMPTASYRLGRNADAPDRRCRAATREARSLEDSFRRPTGAGAGGPTPGRRSSSRLCPPACRSCRRRRPRTAGRPVARRAPRRARVCARHRRRAARHLHP